MNLTNLSKQLGGECKFADSCREKGTYNPVSPTCTQTGGMYYGQERPAGCYRRMYGGQKEKN